MESDPVDAPNVALVHEWLSSRAGSEKTFEQMAAVFPHADLYALTHNSLSGLQFPSPVKTTALQRSSFLARHRAAALPLMPVAWKALNPPAYDAVVTSSHAFSRYFPVQDAVHLSYVYTPLRYAWLPGVDGRGSSPLFGGARTLLRRADLRSVGSVHQFAGISTVVRDRIREIYERDAEVIFPPVDIEYFSDHDEEPTDYVLGVSRWIPYKRLDLVIDAAEAVGRPAVIAGDGPLEADLRDRARRASVPVRIVRAPSDEELRRLYAQAAVLVFPAEEDFGIVPVEAQAAGTPVVALAAGGSLDTVSDGETGALVTEQTLEAMAAGIERAVALGRVPRCEHVEQFSGIAFRRRFGAWVLSAV